MRSLQDLFSATAEALAEYQGLLYNAPYISSQAELDAKLFHAEELQRRLESLVELLAHTQD